MTFKFRLTIAFLFFGLLSPAIANSQESKTVSPTKITKDDTVWTQEPYQAILLEAAGISSRGIAYWQQGIDRRLRVVRGSYLYALNPQTGAAFPDFGSEEPGRINLAYSATNANNFSLTTSASSGRNP